MLQANESQASELLNDCSDFEEDKEELEENEQMEKEEKEAVEILDGSDFEDSEQNVATVTIKKICETPGAATGSLVNVSGQLIEIDDPRRTKIGKVQNLILGDAEGLRLKVTIW